MSPRIHGLLIACLCGLVATSAASAANAGRTFTGNVCSLFTAKQIAAIVADKNPGKYTCVATKTLKTPAGTTYGAHAGSATVTGGGYFSIQLVKYSNPAIEGRVQTMYKATMKPVAGVGDWAYSRIAMSRVVGGSADTGQFAFGAKGFGVVLTVRAELEKTVRRPALTNLAKKIAAGL